MRNRQSDCMRQAFQVFLISPLSQTRVPLLDNLTTVVSRLFFPPHECVCILASITPSINLVCMQMKIGTIINSSQLLESCFYCDAFAVVGARYSSHICRRFIITALLPLFMKGPQMTLGIKSVDISAALPPVFHYLANSSHL